MRLRLKLSNAGGDESFTAKVETALDVSNVKLAAQDLICAEINKGSGFDISWQLGDVDTIPRGADGDREGPAEEMVAMVRRWMQ